MSNMTVFKSKDQDFFVIDMPLTICRSKQCSRDEKPVFDQHILLLTTFVIGIKKEIESILSNHPNAFIGINMEFVNSCRDNSAFNGFASSIKESMRSRIFFYNFISDSELQQRMRYELELPESCLFKKDGKSALFLADADDVDRENCLIRCETIIQNELETYVREIISDRKRELLSSSNVYVDRYVDVKKLFLSPEKLSCIIYYMTRKIIPDIMKFDALVSTSKNGAVLACLIGELTGKEVIYCINVGPQFALPARMVENSFQPGKKYMYIYDFICLGTEVKLLNALIASRNAELYGGVGVASFIRLDNEDLREKHSPLWDISCLVNLMSAQIPYHVYFQKERDDTEIAGKSQS